MDRHEDMYLKKFVQKNPSVAAYAWLNAYCQRNYIKYERCKIPKDKLYYDRNIMMRLALTGNLPMNKLRYFRQRTTNIDEIIKDLYNGNIKLADGKISFNMSIDINSDDFYLFFDFARIICNARRKYGECISTLGFAGDCQRDKKCSLCDSFTLNEYIKRRLKSQGHSLAISSIYTRIVGLWMWDEVYASKCSVAEAKRRLVECGYADDLGFGESEYSRFHRAYTSTESCILHKKILPMS